MCIFTHAYSEVSRLLLPTILVCGFGFILQACQLTGDDATKKAVEELRLQVKELDERVTTHDASLVDYESRLIDLERNSAEVAATGGGFDIAKTDFGPVTVSVKEAVPYVNGYRLRLQLGNLTTAELNGVTLKVRWGPPRNADRFKGAATEWRKAQHTNEFKLLKPLQPGAFNSAEVILSPAAADELGQIRVSMSVDSIVLRKN